MQSEVTCISAFRKQLETERLLEKDSEKFHIGVE